MIELIKKISGKTVYVPETSSQEINDILKKASKTFETWRNTPIKQRIKLFRNLKEVLKKRGEKDILETIREETGKPTQDFIFGELAPIHNLIKFIYRKEIKDFLENGVKVWGGPFFIQRKKKVIYEPIGKILILSSWNFPFGLAMGDSLEAIIGGNVVILKHSSLTPLTSLVIQDCLKEAGFPDGILQVVIGPGSKIGKMLAENETIDMIALTGGQEAGKELKEIADRRGIPIEMELGGSNPAIVLSGTNLERAANAIIWGRFMNAGQTCNSIKRVYVEEPIYENFLKMVLIKIKTLRKDKDRGPIINRGEMLRLLGFIGDAVNKKAEVIKGGFGMVEKNGTSYLLPTVLININHSMRIMQEECFGPIMPIMRVKDYKEALKLANDSPFGLGASIFAKKNDPRVKELIQELKVGTVNVNSVMDEFAVIGLPFVGRKQSGWGHGRHGIEGIKRFMRAKGVLIDSGFMKKEIQWYPYNDTQLKVFKLAQKLKLI